jgi:FdhD protein
LRNLHRMADIRLLTPGGAHIVQRSFATEAPIAVEYGGIGYAVMMATPRDLEDFAVGFSLSEGLIAQASDIIDVMAHDTGSGWRLRIELAPKRMAPVLERARLRVSESSCGLCGLESLEQVMRPLPRITAKPHANAAGVFAALAALPLHQPMNAITGAVHAAAFCDAAGNTLLVREDVGRHNALDKLIGALARTNTAVTDGFFLLTARCSYELVEKTILVGCPMLVTVSAATDLAIARAKAHGLTLISLARADSMQLLSDPFGF